MARNQPITKIEAIGLALAIIALALWFVPATQVWLADRGVHVVIAWVILTMGAAGLEKLSARSWKRIGLTTVVTGILAGSLLLLVSWSEQRRAIPEPTPTPYVEVVVYPLFRDAYETYKLQLGLPNKNGEDAGETYIYAFEHAEVFWSWVLGGFYKIPINNERKWEYNKEPVFKQG